MLTNNAGGILGDVVGNVWQWTETPIAGFPGFEVHALYDDFSTPTFDMRHNLIKGGSWISTGNEATRDSRYAFRRHFFQHAGFRYVVSEQPVEVSEAMYETDALVSQYCEFHYGREYFGVRNFMVAAAAITGQIFDAREVFGMEHLWRDIEALDNRIPAEVQLEMLMNHRRLVRRATRWFLRSRNRNLSIQENIDFFVPAFVSLKEDLYKLLDE